MKFDKMMKRASLFESNKTTMSKIVFNLWDWSIDEKHELLEMRKVYARELKLNLDEEKIKAKIKSRTKA